MKGICKEKSKNKIISKKNKSKLFIKSYFILKKKLATDNRNIVEPIIPNSPTNCIKSECA